MNERIDKMIEQCTVQNFSDCVGGYETFDKEKFAELIVKECLNICQECIDDGCVEAEEPMWKIEEHFGVE